MKKKQQRNLRSKRIVKGMLKSGDKVYPLDLVCDSEYDLVSRIYTVSANPTYGDCDSAGLIYLDEIGFDKTFRIERFVFAKEYLWDSEIEEIING